MSQFEVSAAVFAERLAAVRLSKRSRELITWATRRLDGVILWVDKPWAELDFEALATKQSVVVAVFAAPVELEDGLVLDHLHLLGKEDLRPASCFVFLDVVRCHDLATLPDTHTVFAGGLEVERLACFAAPDASTVVEKLLRAAVVLDGLGDGFVELMPRTKKTVGQFITSERALAKALKGSLAPLAARFDDEAAWEIARDVAAGDETL